MRTFFITCTMVLFSILSFAQQFQLEATVDRNINAIFDIDGDGICEYIADTNKVYDGLTHLLKYTLPGSLSWGDETSAQNPYSNFAHIDYNSDGNREVIVSDNSVYQDSKVYIYDLINNQILLEFNPPEQYGYFKDLVDIDGDGFLEMILAGASYNYPNPDIYKTYIYSTGITTTVNEIKNSETPTGYDLMQNYPNPFNPSTTIRYSIISPETVSIKIYDISGQMIKEIIKEHNQPGDYEVNWYGNNNYGNRVSSGTYFYQIKAGDYSEAKKMILLK